MKNMIIKVCGMRDGENIRQVAELGVDWIGMIFWDKSPRNVTMIPTNAGIIPDRAPSGVTNPLTSMGETGSGVGNCPLRVGVFVDEMPQNIITRVVNFKLDIVQFHGHETPTLIRNIRRTLDPDIRPGIKFIKAISVEDRNDIAAYKDYEDCVDYLLFDTKATAPTTSLGEAGNGKTAASAMPGGTGRHFDWTVLSAYDGTLPFLLSGGIGPDDAPALRQAFALDGFPVGKCLGIDLNSRFETEPAIKDVAAIRSFLSQLFNGANESSESSESHESHESH